MNANALAAPRWTTASFAHQADTMPAELSELGDHVSRCNGCRGRWFTVCCAFDAVHDFVAGRFVTTLLIAGSVVGLCALAF